MQQLQFQRSLRTRIFLLKLWTGLSYKNAELNSKFKRVLEEIRKCFGPELKPIKPLERLQLDPLGFGRATLPREAWALCPGECLCCQENQHRQPHRIPWAWTRTPIYVTCSKRGLALQAYAHLELLPVFLLISADPFTLHQQILGQFSWEWAILVLCLGLAQIPLEYPTDTKGSDPFSAPADGVQAYFPVWGQPGWDLILGTESAPFP